MCVFHLAYMIISVLNFFLEKQHNFFIKTEYVYSVAYICYIILCLSICNIYILSIYITVYTPIY